jgi:MFS family permease
VQGGRGGGATAAAGVVTPVMLTWATSGIIAAPMVVKFGFRKTSLIGASLIVIGFAALLVCALVESPRWIITAVLALTGFGFGPCSMSYLLAAQEAVTWQQRGIATSSVQFFRSVGGAMGIGILGAQFNVLIRSDLRKLEAQGAKPATLLDPSLHDRIPKQILLDAQHMIAGGLKWVFAAMVVFAVAQFVMTMFMPAKRSEHRASPVEALEAVG